MKIPEIILVEIRNGDAAVILNEVVIYSLDATDSGESPSDVAEKLAAALKIDVQTVEMDVPSDEDWGWDDVVELLPAHPNKLDRVPVAHWDSKVYHEDMSEPDKGKPYLLEVTDQRESNGQLFVDLANEDGNLDDMLSATFEVNSLPGVVGDMPCMHLHFDGDSVAASFFKQGDHFIVRPESDVRMTSTVLDTGEHVWILE